MPSSYLLRTSAAVAASALALAALAIAPPASAAPVFNDSETHLDPFGGAYAYPYVGASDCGYVATGGAEPEVPVVENGAATSTTTSASATYTNTSIPGDTATASGGATATGSVKSAGGNLTTMDMTVAANATFTNVLGTSPECVREFYTGIDLDFEFTVTQPGFVTLSTQSAGGLYGEAYIYKYDPADGDSTTAYVDVYGAGTKFNGTVRAFLPAGTYRGYLEGEAFKYARASWAQSGTTTMHAEFHAAGAQTAGHSGKATKYVQLSSVRSCPLHSVTGNVATKKKDAAKVKELKVFVNDQLVKKIKKPKAGAALSLPVADDVAADIRTEVTLFPKKKGKPGKVVESSAAYEACS